MPKAGAAPTFPMANATQAFRATATLRNTHTTSYYTLPLFGHTNFENDPPSSLRVIGRAKYLLITAKQESNDIKCNLHESVTPPVTLIATRLTNIIPESLQDCTI